MLRPQYLGKTEKDVLLSIKSRFRNARDLRYATTKESTKEVCKHLLSLTSITYRLHKEAKISSVLRNV
jgi:hypothetical protein